MHNKTAAGPCVLFVNGTSNEDYECVRQWLSASRFHIYEAADVFDALEEIYDFTGSEMPNVIVVPSLLGADAMSDMMDARVCHYSSDARKPDCIKDLRQLADKLNNFFPPVQPTQRASA